MSEPKRMRAWQFDAVGQPLTLVERSIPVPKAGELLVQVHAAGMCHSDVGYLDGVIPALRLPHILGHEVAGTVAGIGDGVTRFALGDRVVLVGDLDDPSSPVPGIYSDGGYAEYTISAADWTIALPKTVSYAQAAVAADAGATAHGAVMSAGALIAGHRVGIVGVGGLGMTAVKIAHHAGAEVVVAEPRAEVWHAALGAGASHVVTDAGEWVGDGLDLVVDFAGFGSTTASAIAAVRPGGRVVQVGLGQVEATISTAQLVGSQVSLHGFRGGSLADVRDVIDLIGQGVLDITVEPSTFDDIPDTLERLRRGKVLGRPVALL